MSRHRKADSVARRRRGGEGGTAAHRAGVRMETSVVKAAAVAGAGEAGAAAASGTRMALPSRRRGVAPGPGERGAASGVQALGGEEGGAAAAGAGVLRQA